MTPAEIVYEGYIKEHEDIDTLEVSEATDNFQSMIEGLLPGDIENQHSVFAEGLYLAELSQKQGFVAGFTFALEMLGINQGNGRVDNI